MMTVSLIPVEATHPLRLLVLRPGGTLDDTKFAGDTAPLVFHMGTYRDGACISVGSFLPEAHPDLHALRPYRLRGMATHPDHQGTGAGSQLINAAVEYLKEQGCDLLWCNARLKAVPFYERQGFVVHGDLFDIGGIGPHYLMHRAVPAEG